MKRKNSLTLHVWFLCLISIAVCAFFSACGGGPEAQIHKLLDNRSEAMEKRDLNLYMSVISESYEDGAKDYDRMKARAERLFKNLNSIEFGVQHREIRLASGQDNAIVIQKCVVAFEMPTGDVKKGVGEERLRLRREGEEWKILSGMIDSVPKSK